MYIDEPLHTLDIVIDEDTDNAILRANKNEFLGRGTKEYILSYRNETLSNRGYIVPEDWDYEWNVHLGPVWTPDVLGSTKVVSWISPEYLKLKTGSTTLLAQASDRSGNDNHFDGPTGKEPSLSTTKLNYMSGIDFDGSDDFMWSEDGDYGKWFEPGTGDFVVAFVINTGTDQNNTPIIAAMGGGGVGADEWSVQIINSSSDANYTHTCDNDVNTQAGWAASQNAILVVSRTSGTNDIRLNGTSLGTATTADAVTDNTGRGIYIGCFLNSGNTAEDHHWDGIMYEALWVDASQTTAEIQKIEGYLAHKFKLTGNLPAAHSYKSDPPRRDVV